MSPVIRAIDVGYSWTKYVIDGSSMEQIRCRAFPSIAPRASGRDLAVDGLTRRQTVKVDIDDVAFEVGPEATLVQDVIQALPLDDGYIETPEYLALVRGALRLMHVDEVDLLVVGLPVALFREREAALTRRLLGAHPTGPGAAVRVRAVKVLAQPVGALLSAMIEHASLRHLQGARALVVDAGWRTLDWIVTSSPRILDKRTDSVSKSMFDVVDAMARAIARDLGVQMSPFDYARIDEALRKKEPTRFFGKPFPLEPYLPLGQRIADEAVTALRRLVQGGTDVDHILLAGGSAFFFADALARAYPRHALTTLPGSFFANCRGFQIAGLQQAQVDLRGKAPAGVGTQ
jgi:plasmid segregation protein ParM